MQNIVFFYTGFTINMKQHGDDVPLSDTCQLCITTETIVSKSTCICLAEYTCFFPLVWPLCIIL